jgi:signal transduction histidine kinase
MADVEALLRTIEELGASRARLVESAQQDRLRLERQLHDGAQQRLFAIQIKLEAARERAAGDDERARELAELVDDAHAAVEDLRALAQGLYPVALRERGLAGALRTIPYETEIRVDVVDRGVPRCAPAVEEAVYFAVAEAIRSSGGSSVTVTVEPSPQGLAFAVEHDGPGYDADAITGMRDRIDAVGGELDLVSAPDGGTTVRGRVPSDGGG